MLELFGWVILQIFFTLGFLLFSVTTWFAAAWNSKWTNDLLFPLLVAGGFGVGAVWAWSMKPFSIIFGG